MKYALKVQVNEQLTLDAGTLVADTPDAAHGTVRPPAVPMVEQVLAFLSRQPAEPNRAIDEAELAQATVAIDNSGSLEFTRRQVAAAWSSLA